MGNFCKYCGKQLNDGEVCTCTQQQTVETPIPPRQSQAASGAGYQQFAGGAAGSGSDANSFINGLLKTVAGIFVKPKTAAKEFVESKNYMAALIMIGLHTLFSAMFALVLFGVFNGKINDALGFLGSVEFSLVQIYLITFLFSLVISAVFFGLNALLSVMFKSDFDIKSAVCVTGVRSMACVPMHVLATIFCILNPAIGIVVYAVGFLVSIIFFQQTLSVSLKAAEEYHVYICIVMSVVLLIMFYLLLKIGGSVYMPDGSDLFRMAGLFS